MLSIRIQHPWKKVLVGFIFKQAVEASRHWGHATGLSLTSATGSDTIIFIIYVECDHLRWFCYKMLFWNF